MPEDILHAAINFLNDVEFDSWQEDEDCLVVDEAAANSGKPRKIAVISTFSDLSLQRNATWSKERLLNAVAHFVPFYMLNDKSSSFQDCPKYMPVEQTLPIDPVAGLKFSCGGLAGLSQAHFQNLDGLDDGDRPFVVEGVKTVKFAVAWQGYRGAYFPIDIVKRQKSARLEFDNQTLRPETMDSIVERQITVKEMASEVLCAITTWFLEHSLKSGAEANMYVPQGLRIDGDFPDIRMDQIRILRIAPVVGEDQAIWISELVYTTC